MKVVKDSGYDSMDESSKELYERIIKGKQEMNELAKYFGNTHELSVAKSQELDKLIFEYMMK